MGKDKGKGKGKPKGYGKDPIFRCSMDGGKFAIITEEDIDWGHEDQWGSGSQDAWNVSSVARSQESDAPWNTMPDPSWTQSTEGSAWYTKGCASIGARRSKARPVIRSMNPVSRSTPPGLGMYSVGVKAKAIETRNRFETLEASEGDTTDETGQGITMLVKSEVVKSKVEAKASRKQRLKETKEERARMSREEDELLEQEAIISEALIQYTPVRGEVEGKG